MQSTSAQNEFSRCRHPVSRACRIMIHDSLKPATKISNCRHLQKIMKRVVGMLFLLHLVCVICFRDSFSTRGEDQNLQIFSRLVENGQAIMGHWNLNGGQGGARLIISCSEQAGKTWDTEVRLVGRERLASRNFLVEDMLAKYGMLNLVWRVALRGASLLIPCGEWADTGRDIERWVDGLAGRVTQRWDCIKLSQFTWEQMEKNQHKVWQK